MSGKSNLTQHLLIIESNTCVNCGHTWTSQHGTQTGVDRGYSYDNTLTPVTHYSTSSKVVLWSMCYQCLPIAILAGAPIDHCEFSVWKSKPIGPPRPPVNPKWGTFNKTVEEPNSNAKTQTKTQAISDAALDKLLGLD